MTTRQFYVYIYRDPSNNDMPIYVGKGNGRRAYAHLNRTDNGPLPNKLNKMKQLGIEPIIEIIPALAEWHAFFMEECLVSMFGRKNNGTGILLNLTDGGEGVSGRVVSPEARIAHSKKIAGKTHTDATKLKMSKAKQGVAKTKEHKANQAAAMKGKKPAKTTIDAVKLANTGRTHTVEQKLLMSTLAKKRGRSDQHAANLTASHVGKTRSEETKQKMKAAWIIRRANKESV